MKLKPGDDVIVDFDGTESPGEVINTASGYVLCRIAIDPEGDYGKISASLAPYSHVCVKETDVRLVDKG